MINHPNRKAHNWLLYDLGEKWLLEYSKYYKGNLYDLGCGEAPYKDFFLKYCNTYTGVDWSSSMHNCKADIISNLNEKLNLNDNIADTVISLSVMEHLCEPQIFLNECNRILKDNGTLILSVPWMWHIHEAPNDYYRFTPYGLKYLLKKAGFSEVHIQPTTGFFTTIFVKINYFTLRLIKGSELRRKLIKPFLLPFWFISQKIAPILDNMHRGWSLEAQSFYVIAKKSKV